MLAESDVLKSSVSPAMKDTRFGRGTVPGLLLMALTESAQSCSPKLLTLSGRQSSGQRSGIVITSSSAGVSAASNRPGIATGSLVHPCGVGG